MSIKLVDDNEMKSDFAYQESKEYQIFVKKSVFDSLLKQEMKNPFNWVLMISQVIRLLGVILYEVISISFFIALLMWLFTLDGQNRISIFNDFTVFSDGIRLFAILYIQAMPLVFVYLVFVKYQNKRLHDEVFKNAFSDKVSKKIYQHILVEEAKRQK